jgi:hypothetical protein
MSGTETKRNNPKHLHFCFALSHGSTRPKQPKQPPKGGGEFVSPLARAAARSVPTDRGTFSAPLALRYGGPLHLGRTP